MSSGRVIRAPMGCNYLPRRISRAALKVKAVGASLPSPVPAPSGSSPAPAASTSDECQIYVDRNGNMVQAMCADYGFRSGGGRLYQDQYGEVPKSLADLARDNFRQELTQLRQSVRANDFKEIYEPGAESGSIVSKGFLALNNAVIGAFAALDHALEDAGVLSKLEAPVVKSGLESKEFRELKDKLDRLQLSVPKVVAFEHAREAKSGALESPWWVKVPFYALCWVLDVMYEGRPIQKFWVLEVVARIPYFAYISILHFYESVGFWRAGAELRKVHFAEEWNEMHHLQIMESLGGDQRWLDRFVAEHAAVLYYWVLILFYVVSPKVAYNFMQRVELHAYDTYCVFVEENKELLKDIPPPMVALNYYLGQDLYLFDSFQQPEGSVQVRRPSCSTLLETFTNIRDDEFEHVKTMIACQQDNIAQKVTKNITIQHTGSQQPK